MTLDDKGEEIASNPAPHKLPQLPDEETPQRQPDVLLPAISAQETSSPPNIIQSENPPLPEESTPKRPPDQLEQALTTTESNTENTYDDGWEAVWEASVNQYYFYNRITKETTWDNPRVPEEKPAEEKPLTLAERLAKDPEFQKLSRSDRIKRYEEEQAKLDKELLSSEPEQVPLEINAKKHAQMLTSAFGDATGKARESVHRISKDEVKQYKRQKKERKEKKLREWLLD